jgi:hypothetical protein
MSALQGNACLKRMTPSPPAAAVIEAFAGIPGLLEQTPALMARGRANRGRDRWRQRHHHGTTRSFSDEREPGAISPLYCAGPERNPQVLDDINQARSTV